MSTPDEIPEINGLSPQDSAKSRVQKTIRANDTCESIVMNLPELLKQINDNRLKLNLPLVTEDRFLEEITVMQLSGKLIISEGMVYSL